MSQDPGEAEPLAEGTLISHLLELRTRLLRSLVAAAIVFLLSEAASFITGTRSDSALYCAELASTKGLPPLWFMPPMTFDSRVSLDVLA